MSALNMRLRLSEPKPAFCSGCHKGATEKVRFVDFDASHDSGMVEEIREDGMVVKRMPGDDLHLCESCVRQAAEVIAYKPTLHAEQVQKIRALERQRDHYKHENEQLRQIVGREPAHV